MRSNSANGIPKHSVNGISKKFLRMSELYRHFAREMGEADFSDKALLNLYNAESYGSVLTPDNGFAVGKKYLNLQVTMWREDIRKGWICKQELYTDSNYPHWWLDSVLKNLYDGYSYKTLLEECNKI